MGTRRHQVIASTFGGCSGQNGRFNVDKTTVIQKTTDTGADFGSQHQIVQHVRAAQVQEPVFQADFLAHFGMAIELERRRFGLVQHHHFLAQKFHLAGGHLGIDCALGTAANATRDLQHPLRTCPIGGGKGLGGVRINHHLQDAGAIAHIQENHPTVIPATVDPATNRNGLI